MAKSSLRYVIVSRDRADSIITHKLVEDADILVPKSQMAIYRKALKQERILPVPDNVTGTAALKNFVGRTTKEKAVIVFDDDITHLYCLCGAYAKTLPPSSVRPVVEQALCCAADAGTPLFGFNQKWDTRKFAPNSPFCLNTWVSCVVGIIGKDVLWDERLKCKSDIDACLRILQKYRIIWTDCRFSWSQNRDNNAGGNARFKTAEIVDKELEYLKKKWGDHFRVSSPYATNISCSISVPRRQQLKHYDLKNYHQTPEDMDLVAQGHIDEMESNNE